MKRSQTVGAVWPNRAARLPSGPRTHGCGASGLRVHAVSPGRRSERLAWCASITSICLVVLRNDRRSSRRGPIALLVFGIMASLWETRPRSSFNPLHSTQFGDRNTRPARGRSRQSATNTCRKTSLSPNRPCRFLKKLGWASLSEHPASRTPLCVALA